MAVSRLRTHSSSTSLSISSAISDSATLLSSKLHTLYRSNIRFKSVLILQTPMAYLSKLQYQTCYPSHPHCALQLTPVEPKHDLTPYNPFPTPQGLMIQLPMLQNLGQARAYHAYLTQQRPIVNYEYSSQDARRFAAVEAVGYRSYRPRNPVWRGRRRARLSPIEEE